MMAKTNSRRSKGGWALGGAVLAWHLSACASVAPTAARNEGANPRPPGAEDVQRTEDDLPASATSDLTDPAAFDAARSYVDTPFGRVAVVAHGHGPAAVFLHGFPLNAYHWRHQLTALADVRTCIAIDLMGLGHTEIRPEQDLRFSSQARMVLATLDAMHIDDFDLVGNDSGSGIAQIIAAMAPQRVRSLVLTNGDTHDNWPPKALGTIHDAAAQGVLANLFDGYLNDVQEARRGMAKLVLERPDQLTDTVNATYLRPLLGTPERRANMHRFITSQDNAETVAIKDALARLRAPTLILWGTDDVFFGVEWAYWLRDTIPGAQQVVELPGAKLFFAEERADEVNAQLRAFWQRGSVDD